MYKIYKLKSNRNRYISGTYSNFIKNMLKFLYYRCYNCTPKWHIILTYQKHRPNDTLQITSITHSLRFATTVYIIELFSVLGLHLHEIETITLPPHETTMRNFERERSGSHILYPNTETCRHSLWPNLSVLPRVNIQI
jgi:hypothetical protein